MSRAISGVWHRHYGKLAFIWSTLTVAPMAALHGTPTAIAAFVHVMLSEYKSFIVLLFTLHRSFHSHYWRAAWVGFDFVLLFGFAATGWAFWRGRQIVIACLVVTGTLLCCDAWFDVILDLGTSGQWQSIASALIVELPIAFLMFAAARRLIRLSAVVAVSKSADGEPPPSLWRTALVGDRVRPSE